MPGIDLHAHSTASDGTLRPAEVVQAAYDKGLTAIALTDHDTADGLPEFIAAGERIGIRTVPGCELSVTGERARFHILGLYLPATPQILSSHLEELREHRHQRNYIILDKLRELGCDISYDEVQEISGGGSVGRPHIAQALMKHGYVNSIDQAFKQYLAAGGKAYEPKKVLGAADAISLLKKEQATVMLAHPFQYALGMDVLAEELIKLKDLGLDGLEAYYNDHSPSKVQALAKLAAKLDLQISGGSDFHGDAKPAISLGTGRGSMHIPESVLETLDAYRIKQGLPI